MARDGNLRELFMKNLPQAHWQPIETWVITTGVPDAEFCFEGGITGWIEFKWTKGNKVGLRPEQVAWIERRNRKGGRTFVAVRKHNAKVDELFLFHGRDVRLLYTDGLGAVKPAVHGPGGPGKWPWTQVEKVINRLTV